MSAILVVCPRSAVASRISISLSCVGKSRVPCCPMRRADFMKISKFQNLGKCLLQIQGMIEFVESWQVFVDQAGCFGPNFMKISSISCKSLRFHENILGGWILHTGFQAGHLRPQFFVPATTPQHSRNNSATPKCHA